LRPASKARKIPAPFVPTKNELQAIAAGAAGRWRSVMLVAILCGLQVWSGNRKLLEKSFTVYMP
jgi:hypothetical protein